MVMVGADDSSNRQNHGPHQTI